MQKKKKSKQQEIEKQNKKAQNPLVKLLVNMFLLLSIIVALIYYSDKKGYFNADERNNHTKKKWNSFYKLTSEKKKIDVILLGNSHLYTGINPKNFSLALGVNAFVLASPGETIADTYFSLKEAVKQCKPKLVIVETYGMNDFNPFIIDNKTLSVRFKCFSARKDFLTKIESTPRLFSLQNYLYAWSTTIRNHDYIFTNQKQLSSNRKLIDNPIKKPTGLYLGRFARFFTGIKEETLVRYEKEGAPVKGSNYKYSDYTELYVKKIVDLCKHENIELMFLTLPMYKKHIADYDLWHSELAEVLGKYPNKWLDMQKEPNYDGFETFAFEDTYDKNQHITYYGSLLATSKLLDFVRDSLSVNLRSRQNDANWHKMFYGGEGYFENFNPKENDKENKVICLNKTLRNIPVKSVVQLKTNNKKADKLIAKIDKKLLKNINCNDIIIRVVLKYEVNGREQMSNLDLVYDRLYNPQNDVLFSAMIKPLKLKDVVDGAIVKTVLR